MSSFRDPDAPRTSAPRNPWTGRSPARFDRDACGIGLVADLEGRASRALLDSALVGLACVRHRGAVAADGVSGDGAGILLPIPQTFFGRVAREAGLLVPDGSPLGVVTAFLDGADDDARRIAEQAVADACAAEHLVLLGWRPMPTDDTLLGVAARRSAPYFTQAILAVPAGEAASDAAEIERRCFRARRRAEGACRAAGVRHYFASWSFATVVYKALVMSDGLSGFYPDLAASDFDAPLVVFHSRFSTNTTPAWERAQPFRYLCHNGEINTLRGNEHRMAARGRLGTDEAGLGPEDLFSPLLDPEDSDSGKLDAAVELLVAGGRDVRHAVAMLVPEAWEGAGHLRVRRPRLLPLPRLPRRAVGRARRADLHRRPAGRCSPRPQRPATAALSGLRRRLRRVRLRGRGGADRRPRQGATRSARPGRDALRRPRRGPRREQADS